MKVLLSGKKGQLYDTMAKALAGLRGMRVEALPPGSQLLEAVQAPAAKALVFTLSSESEMEPLRWVIRQNHNLPLVAVLPRSHPRLREILREEGVLQIVEMPGLTASQLQRKLRESLKALSAESLPTRPLAHASQVARDLHAARSALTAILGNAELALPKCRPSSPQQKQLQDIIRGVDEIERILRRLERALGISQKTPS